MENTILEWISNPKRNYEEGVALFFAAGGNKSQGRYFSATKPEYAMKKLVYELGKLAKKAKFTGKVLPGYLVKPTVEKVEIAPEAQESNVESPTPLQLAKPSDENGEVSTEEQKPNVEPPTPLQLANKIVHETWVELSRIKEELFNLGEGNDPDTIERRQALLEEQQPLIARYNEVYEAKESCAEGEMTEEQLMDVINCKQPSKETEEVDVSNMSDLELAKACKACKATITRCQNQLLYQNDTAKVKGKPLPEKPMPDCPRRAELEAKIESKQKELASLSAALEARNGNT